MFCTNSKFWFYIVLVLILFTLDQLSKKYLLYNVGFDNSAEFIPGILQFTVVQNTGGAFSTFSKFPYVFKLIGIINVFIFSYLLIATRFKFNNITKIGCAFVLGGTLGNVTDRILRGAVTDFLDIQFIKFAVFNLADVFIDVGVVLILVGLYLRSKDKTIEVSNRN